MTDGIGVDAAIEALGLPTTFENCILVTKPGGVISNVGYHGEAGNTLQIPLPAFGLGMGDKKNPHGPVSGGPGAVDAPAPSDRTWPSRSDAPDDAPVPLCRGRARLPHDGDQRRQHHQAADHLLRTTGGTPRGTHHAGVAGQDGAEQLPASRRPTASAPLRLLGAARVALGSK